jgi:hypothetical protein
MTILDTDSLVKPDMIAVLERTHLSHTAHNFLLPVIESTSNALHSLEDKFGDDARGKGEIQVVFHEPNDPKRFVVKVTDNGIGLTPDNFKSFKTPFSGHKLKRKGRGFGRFVSFKVYDSILYSSRYFDEPHLRLRSFKFDLSSDDEIIFTENHDSFPDTGASVTLSLPRDEWLEQIDQLSEESVSNEISGEFLPHFLNGWLPSIVVKYGSRPSFNLRDRFKAVFVETESGSIECEIDGGREKIYFSIARIPKTMSYKTHCLLFSAADRIVGSPRDLSNKIGQPHFVDDKDEKYIIVVVVRSDAFDRRLDDHRARINISASVIEDIVSRVSEKIEALESGQIRKIKTHQAVDLEAALRENPILRAGLRGRTISEYVAGKPNVWKAEQFISDLAIMRYRDSEDLSKAIAAAAANPDNYVANLHEIAGKLDQTKKDALAEYVLHRKSVIELVEAARKFKADGGLAPEDEIHELVFRRFGDSKTVQYFQHNLWLIDDTLAFLPYVSSDRTFHGSRRKKGDKVADLVFFDESLVLGDDQGHTVVIVEFKRPSRDDYRFGDEKSDPVRQVVNTFKKATVAGGITKTDGTHQSFSAATRRFGFIVADLTPSLIEVLKEHDFRNEWDPRVFFRFRDNEQLYIQCFGYDHMVETAKKRNQAFFRVLFGD